MYFAQLAERSLLAKLPNFVVEILRLPDVKTLAGCDGDKAREIEVSEISGSEKRLISIRREFRKEISVRE